jgi:hypothetical protein
VTTLLVLTAGQTDVQLVVDGVRRELRRDRCAALHDEIERRASRWRIVDAPDRKTEPPVEALPERELLLCTPKLDAVLREVVPASALLLETRRDARSAPGDPRFAGAVLEARLKARGAETVHRRAYLQGTERLEDRDEARDAVIRREVVHRLEQAVRDTIETEKPSRIVVAATGGFPVVSNLVEEDRPFARIGPGGRARGRRRGPSEPADRRSRGRTHVGARAARLVSIASPCARADRQGQPARRLGDRGATSR